MTLGLGLDPPPTAPTPSEPGASDAVLRQAIRRVRRLWRLRVLLRGAALALAAGLLVLLATSWGLDRVGYDPLALAGFRAAAWIGAVALGVRLLVLPLRTRVSDERIALYIEEHEPSLQAALLAALEAGRGEPVRRGASAALSARLLENVARRCRELDGGRAVERGGLARASGLLAAAALLAMLGALLGPAFLRRAAPLLLAPWSARAASPWSIAVAPGDARVARGADLEVRAQLVGFDVEAVELVFRREAGDWSRWPMTLDAERGDFAALLLDLEAPTEYRVEAGRMRSDAFRVAVVDVPHVERIDLEYRFPDYTGLAPETVEDGGDVAALVGTEVRLRVRTTLPVAAGRLALDGVPAGELAAAADSVLEGAFAVARDGRYRVELPGADGALAPASREYLVRALEDQPPSVSFLKPGRDVRTSPIDEVFAEARAEDDFGLTRLELVYSVNGGEQRAVRLAGPATPRRALQAGHTLLLEELALQPGDLVAYYARASAVGPAGPQAGASDIYFVEVRPFSRSYRQAEQGGMGGGAMEAGGALGFAQRQVIAATFKLVRDRGRLDADSFRRDLASVADAQRRLRGQAAGLEARLRAGLGFGGGELATAADALREAGAAMEQALAELEATRPEPALAPEQRALAQLQRAEAVFRELQVAMGQGGGSPAEGERDLEELHQMLELELDKLRNQYETLARGTRQQLDQELQAALERLAELARRQQQENERLRREQGAALGAAAPGGGDALAREAEELARRLERLSREERAPRLAESARRLREAAEAMRRAQAAGERERLAAGLEAERRLQSARRQLEDARGGSLADRLEAAAQRAEELARSQAGIAHEAERVARGSEAGQLAAGREGTRADEPGVSSGSGLDAGRPGSAERRERLIERKDALAEGVAELHDRIQQLARDAHAEQPEAARRLEEAARAVEDDKLREKILYSKGALASGRAELLPQLEPEIQADLEAFGRRLRDAAGALAGRDDPRVAALAHTRRLARSLESLEQRLRERGERLAPQEARQLRRETGERLSEARTLQQGLPAGTPRGLGDVVDTLGALNDRVGSEDPALLAALAADALEALKAFEYALVRQAQQGEGAGLALGALDEVPEEWRPLVEEYYRSLAREETLPRR